MAERVYKIMIAVGEPSGDMYAADLIRQLRLDSGSGGFDFFGMGLAQMKGAGLRQLVDATELSLVGLFEVIAHYPSLRRAYRRLLRALAEEKPDLLVLVDYPEFNLRLAADAKRFGVKTLFYISPQVWAWRAGRVKKIARCVDMMAVVFPFEEKIYRDAGVAVRYVGHPLVDRMGKAPPRAAGGGTRLLLMPGSRLVEVRRLLPVLCRAAVKLAAHEPSVRFSLLLAPGIPAGFVERHLRAHRLECELVRENAETVMCESDLAITASGTATLQLALCGTPMIVVYKLLWSTYFLLRWLVTIPYISLVNIIAGKMVVPELIQGAANEDEICREALALLQDKPRIRELRQELLKIRPVLGDGGSIENLAGLVREMVGDGGCGPGERGA